MKTIRISFPFDLRLASDFMYSVEVRLESLAQYAGLKEIPKLHVEDARSGNKDFSVLVITCHEEDHPILFGFYEGINLIRYNLNYFKE